MIEKLGYAVGTLIDWWIGLRNRFYAGIEKAWDDKDTRGSRNLWQDKLRLDGDDE